MDGRSQVGRHDRRRPLASAPAQLGDRGLGHGRVADQVIELRLLVEHSLHQPALDRAPRVTVALGDDVHRAARDARAETAVDEAHPVRVRRSGNPRDPRGGTARGMACGQPAADRPAELVPGHGDARAHHLRVDVVHHPEHEPMVELRREQVVEPAAADGADQQRIDRRILQALRHAFALAGELPVAAGLAYAQAETERARLLGHAEIHRQPVAVLQVRVDRAQAPATRGGGRNDVRPGLGRAVCRAMIACPALQRPLGCRLRTGQRRGAARQRAQRKAEQPVADAPPVR